MEEADLEKLQIEYLIKQTYSYSGDSIWDSAELIDVPQVRAVLVSHSTPALENNLFLMNKKENILLEESLFNIERKKSISNMGYFQTEYREGNDQPFKENMEFHIGLNVPIVNKDRPDLEREKLELVTEKLEYEKDKNTISIDADLNQLQLRNALRQYETIVQKETKSNDVPIANLESRKVLDAIIEINEFIYELRLSKAELYHKVLTKYINLLAHNGEISTTPYVNHLSAEESTFTLIEK